MKSWKTTTSGLAAIFAIVAPMLKGYSEEGAAYFARVDWNTTLIGLSAGIGLMAARDNKVTSEQAGARDAAPKDDPRQSKLPLVLLVTCLAFAGCSYTRLQRGDATATNVRCLWHTEGFAFTSTTNGEIAITLQKSNPDAEAMKAVAEGAAKGAVQGAK